MTNEELVELVQKNVDVQKNLSALYEQNKKFIYKIVKPFCKYVELDDLLQEGYIGFHDAVLSYVPGTSKLTTYSVWKIRQKCIRYIENCGNVKRIPSGMIQLILKYKSVKASYFECTGKEPSDEQFMKELNCTKQRLKQIRKTMYEQYCKSTDELVPGSEGLTVGDSVADQYNMEEDIQDKEFKEYESKIVHYAVSELPEQEQRVISERYFEGLTQKQIAEQMHLSNSRIGQLENKVLHKLKQNDSLQQLMCEKFGYDSISNYKTSLQYCLDRNTSATERTALNRIMTEDKQKKIKFELNSLFDRIIS